MGKCVDCKRIAVAGKTRCLHCLLKKREQGKAYRIRHKEELSRKYAARRKKRKEEGRCPSCSRPMFFDEWDVNDKTGEPYYECAVCKDQHIERSR